MRLRHWIVCLYLLSVGSPSAWPLCWPTKGFDWQHGYLVFVDRLSKMAYLAAVLDSIDGEGTAFLFIDRVFRPHGLPLKIVFDEDPRSTGKFWKYIFKVLGTILDMSTADCS